MAGISPKLPLQLDKRDGIALNKTLKETVKQNLKMLVLTSPGERLMLPEYGVGIRNFLFEQNVSSVRSDIASKIREQVKTYMPFITLEDITFAEMPENSYVLNLAIKYSVPQIINDEVLNLQFDNNSAY
ncbi:MAG TPA: hypothetical protein DCM40_08390 [Maribacter sp.]|nr:hypothetical protein [Maribacter sp.]